MWTIAMLSLTMLNVADAKAPKKSKDKTEQSKKEKSTGSSKSKKSSKQPAKKSGQSTKKTTSSSKSSPKSSAKTRSSTTKAPSSKAKTGTQKPTGTNRVNGSPGKQEVGRERQNTPTAHSPIGNNQSNRNQPSYQRAPENVHRPQVGKEQDAPTAHTPIGHSGGGRTPSYDRVPDNVERPQVGKEQDAPTAHTPIGGASTRPEKSPYERPPEGRVDRSPPTKKNPDKSRETERPQKEGPRNGRVDRTPPSNSHPNKENNRTVDRAPWFDRDAPQADSRRTDRNKPDPKRDKTVQQVSPGKSQQRTAPSLGFGTSTRRNSNGQGTGAGTSTSQSRFGLGTLSFASDYVDGGAYKDGGMGLSFGYRPIPQFELEAAYGRYTDSVMESSRNRLNRPLQLTAQVHPFADQFVSPFISGGYVWNDILIDDEYVVFGDTKSAQHEGLLTGLVLGAGVTMNVHSNIALELDGRLFQYNNLERWDDAGDTATLVSMGVVVGF